MDENKKYLGKKEIWLYSVAALGQGMMYAIMSGYITDFYLQVLQLPLVFVLILTFVSRFWDAVNDPIVGSIVDRHTTRWGKFKPYVAFSAIPISVLTFLMFYDWGLSQTQAMIYAAVTYVLWDMAYTVGDVPFWSLPNVMTPNPDERGQLFSLSRTINSIGSAIPTVLFGILFVFAGKLGIKSDGTKYAIIVTFVSVVGLSLYMISCFVVKERVIIPNAPKEKKDPNEPSVLKRLLQCRPLMLVVTMGILASGRYLMGAASVHVARYAFFVGKITEGMMADQISAEVSKSIGTVNTILTGCSAVGMFGTMLVLPILYKKYDYKKIVVIACFAGFLASILTTVFGAISIAKDIGWMFFICIPFLVIQCVPLGVLNVTSYAMVGDCLDYLEWKTGYRDNALGSACQTFVNKLSNALATGFVIIMYIIIGLDPTDTMANGAVKLVTDLSHIQRVGMFSLVSIVPGLSMLVCAIPVFFYDISGEKKKRITAELAQMRQAKGITIE
ncbi:MAG TPA: hypothetical protein DEQ88_00665 [Clostridiales bacterium]|nr:hypothetical protein [Clostridiales bacterium]